MNPLPLVPVSSVESEICTSGQYTKKQNCNDYSLRATTLMIAHKITRRIEWVLFFRGPIQETVVTSAVGLPHILTDVYSRKQYRMVECPTRASMVRPAHWKAGPHSERLRVYDVMEEQRRCNYCEGTLIAPSNGVYRGSKRVFTAALHPRHSTIEISISRVPECVYQPRPVSALVSTN